MAVSFRDAASNAIASSLCTVLAVGDNVYRLFDWGLDPKGRGNVAAGVRRLLCNIEPDDDILEADPPFEGGQCDIRYNGSITVFRSGNPPNNPIVVATTAVSSGPRPLGPISGVYRGPDPGLPFGGTCSSTNTAVGFNTPEGPWVVACFNENNFPITSASITSLSPFSGGNVDDCGDPDPEYPDPEPVVGPTTNITYNIDESTEITVPLTAVFAPIFIKATGQFSFPIRVDVGGVTFSGTFDVSPTVNINIYPDGGGGGSGGTTDEPDDDIPPVDIPDEDETPDFESRIIGVFIRSSIDTNAVRASGIPAGGNLPEIWVPRLANCKFLIRSRATTGWTEDIDVKNANQYIPCPHPGGAVDVRVFPQQGVTVAVEPHRAAPLLPDLPPVEE